MELKGKIIAVLPLQTGEGKNGTWKSQDYVVETEGRYPKKVCFNLFGENIEKYALNYNDQVTVSADVESREYNGRWYTSVKAWKVDKIASAQPQQPAPQSGVAHDTGNDMPF